MLVQLPLKMSLREDASFTTFVACEESLAWVLSQLQQIERVQDAGCYYFFGESGTGKTHLLQGACRFYGERQKQSVFFPLANESLPLIPDVLQGLEVTDLVCLDDVESVLGDVQWENALANLLAKSRVLGHRVLLAGQVSLVNWPVKSESLLREMLSIVPVPLTPLSEAEDLILALKRHAQQRGFELSVEVGRFLIKRFSHDLQELLAVLKLLEQATLVEKRKLTLPFVKDVLVR
ncbi:MAG: DnaA regulatory inactivator Hda [Thiomicrospira sp.]|jgi:DnaA family protein|nr:DnaA regulatory inactivator Hda [Thiomicrospira sp.]